jgi:hypothetical protein
VKVTLAGSDGPYPARTYDGQVLIF